MRKRWFLGAKDWVALFAAAMMISGALARDVSFFEDDVWIDPARPFLFYGEKKKLRKRPFTDIREIRHLDELKREVKRRLEVAVMEPSDTNVARYMEANAWLTEKAGRFAESWKRVMLTHPQYDWTTTHPSVNAASTLLSREREEAIEAYLSEIKDDWALVYFADRSALATLMAPIVKRFSEKTGLELAVVSLEAGAVSEVKNVVADRGYASRVGKAYGLAGLKLFPAVVLMHRDDTGFEMGRLVATGVVDVTELGRRIAMRTGGFDAFYEKRLKTLAISERGQRKLASTSACPTCIKGNQK